MNYFQQIFPGPDPASLKFRNELKYICSESDLQIIQSRITPICPYDRHAGPSGTYHIRSVYFDDPQNRCYYENENGTDPREKFRIRTYNASSKKIKLECKRKERTKTRKTSCNLTKEQTLLLMEGKTIPDIASQPPLLRKLTRLHLKTHPGVPESCFFVAPAVHSQIFREVHGKTAGVGEGTL